MDTYNIYCDESCHLENDKSIAMGMGAIWCSSKNFININKDIKAIKEKHNFLQELKWSKLQNMKLAAYLELVNYFFDNEDLRFRIVIINKKKIKNAKYQQTYDDFYYKMYYQLIHNLITSKLFNERSVFKIFLDIKDTKSQSKVLTLQRCIDLVSKKSCNNRLDKIVTIRSHEIQIMQLVDIIMGALTSHCRGIKLNNAKQSIIKLIKERTGMILKRTTIFNEKFNILHFPDSYGFTR